MARRNLPGWIDALWSDLCVWFVRRSAVPPDQSLRRLVRLSALLKLPCPVWVRRGAYARPAAFSSAELPRR